MTNTFIFANNAQSTLAGGISNTATTCNLASGTGALFPNPSAVQQFSLTFTDLATGLLNEIVYCTARTADVCTIVRAQEGTTALNWSAGDLANNRLTAGQMSAMIQGGIPPATGAQLQYVDTTHLLLAPYSGGQLWINGANYSVPASLEVTTSGLTTNQLYYVYAYLSAEVMTLEAVTTGYTLASNGIPQKSTDPTRTLVGAVFVDGSTHFNDSATKRNVASYFNRRNRDLNGPVTPGTIYSSSSTGEVASSARVEAVTWANESSMINGVGSLSYNAALSICGSQLGVSVNNGVSFSFVGYGVTGTVTNAGDEVASGFGYCAAFAEGHNIFTPGAIIDSSTASCGVSVGIQGLIRS